METKETKIKPEKEFSEEPVELYNGLLREDYTVEYYNAKKGLKGKRPQGEKVVVKANYRFSPEEFNRVIRETKKDKKGKDINVWAKLTDGTEYVVTDTMWEMGKKSPINHTEIDQRVIRVSASAELQEGDTLNWEKGRDIAVVKADLKAMKTATIIAREAIRACTDAVYVYRNFQSEVELRMAGLADQLEIIKGNEVEKEE